VHAANAVRDLLERSEFRSAFSWALVGLGIAIALGISFRRRRGRPAPVAGLAIAGAGAIALHAAHRLPGDVLLGLVLLAGGGILADFFGRPVLVGAVLAIPGALLIGWMAPRWYVQQAASKRLNQIDYDMPELIDLLVVTVEAGLGLGASIQLASTRLGGPLGDELRIATHEQSMGLPLLAALENMNNRVPTPAMRSFVRAMVQGERLGISVGQILRSLAIEMRKRRRAAAEEKAQKAPIKILFPLVFLIFPAMFLVLLGPALFSIFDALKGK